MLLAVGLAVLAALSILLLPRGPAARPLDPDSTASSGARAFAQVLQRHGVELQAVRTGDELRAAHLDGDTTLVVANAGDLSHSDLSFVREQRAVSRLVLLDPTDPVLDGLQVPATAVSRGGRLTAGCTTDIADPQDTMSTGAILYRATGGSGDARRPTTSCFGDDDGATHAYLAYAAISTRPETVVLGQGSMFANAHITRESHAAIALRMFAQNSRVVWFVPTPDPDDPPIEDAGPEAPAWIGPSIAILALTALLLCLWRGRRLGPLVVEPLPVVVPAGETTRARARLYRRSGDDDAIARVLTDAAVNDMRTWLRLPAETPLSGLAQAVHRATGEDPNEVLALLSRPASTTSASTPSLADHAARLRRLRRKVRTS